MRRLKVLISAYAFEPGRGSEPGIGWNISRNMARYHDVWVLTGTWHRTAIEAELAQRPIKGLQIIYYDLPHWMPGNEKSSWGRVQINYYCWQLGVYSMAKRWHQRIGFDVANHLTYGKYWAPSLLSLLPIPFIWGPIVGGESLPWVFWKGLGAFGVGHTMVRIIARCLEEWDPLVRLTARRTALALTPSVETARRLKKLGAQTIEYVQGHGGINAEEYQQLKSLKIPNPTPFRLVSSGRLLPWKGLHLAMRAFAQASLSNAEYWIEGSGPERRRLTALASKLKIAHQVKFFQDLSRTESWRYLEQCHVLLHPSLHDLSTNIILEAMAAGRPVIGFSVVPESISPITKDTGIRIVPHHPQQAVEEMAQAIRVLANDTALHARMGRAAQERVASVFLWEDRCKSLEKNYVRMVEGRYSLPQWTVSPSMQLAKEE